ncbi:MAG: helix-turn-helix transcriptional regulator [Candidatus Nanosalina sp.]
MRKYLIILIIVSISLPASATTISREDVRIDLNNNKVTAELEIEELTSRDLSYVSSHEIKSVNASIEEENVDCRITDSPIGSEIRCPTDYKKNFSVTLKYRITDTVDQRDGVKIFRYDHPVYRPTKNYNLRVLLPGGNALVEEGNFSQQVISPLNYETGSNGRQIFVDWSLKPELGETLSFYILFEQVQNQEGINLSRGLIIRLLGVLLAIILGTAGVIHWRREDLSENLEDLSEDQKDIMDKIENNGGDYLQKDLVDEMDYSKAKISGEVSELVDKGILRKTKEGRSNKLSISRKYRY